ncbi:MAG: flagellar basal body L-ring protein FlgH [Alphaproteobacteria bacterium]
MRFFEKMSKIMIISCCFWLGACNTLSKLTQVGEEPALSPMTNPQHDPDYKPVSMPMPNPQVATVGTNSLWRTGSRAFFKDLRASQIGDIVTVIINIDDQADLTNSSNSSRSSAEDMGLGAFGGYEKSLDSILPEAVDPASLLNFGSTSASSGTGSISREEQIDLSVAAIVTQILPNGNLVIHGRQETKVNYEIRQLQVAGVIRPQDISNSNTIDYDKIAEARLAYGGKGHISDKQEPRWGTQIIDILMPF